MRDEGHDVKSVQEHSPGISDKAVIQLAKADDRIILTFDKDDGEIIFRHGLPHPPAVVFFREKGAEPFFAGRILLALLQAGEVRFKNAYTVVEKDNVRQRIYGK